MDKIQLYRKMIQLIIFLLTLVGLVVHLPFIRLMFIITTFLGGAFYCGWACPFGSVQEVCGALGRRLGIKKKRVPKKLHDVMIYFRYIFGILVLITMTGLILNIMRLDARAGFFTILTGRIPMMITAIALVGFMMVSILYERAFCRYLCPEGGRYGLMSLFRIFSISREEKTCVNCKKCDRVCPMQIEISKSQPLRSPQCINCFKCVNACPIKGCLTYKSLHTQLCTKIAPIMYKSKK